MVMTVCGYAAAPQHTPLGLFSNEAFVRILKSDVKYGLVIDMASLASRASGAP